MSVLPKVRELGIYIESPSKSTPVNIICNMKRIRDKILLEKKVIIYKEIIFNILIKKDYGDKIKYTREINSVNSVNPYIRITSKKTTINEDNFPLINDYYQENNIIIEKYYYDESRIYFVNKNGIEFIMFKGDLNKCYSYLNSL